MAEDGEFVSFHEVLGTLDAGEFMVGVESRRGVAGKVFSATENAGGAKAIIEGAGFLNHLGHIAAIASAPERVVSFIIEGNIEHGTEVEVESEQAEDASGDVSVATYESEVPAVAELLGVGGLVADELESGNSPAFLIDGDDRFHLTEIAEVVDELAELRGGLNIASEENEAAGLDLAEEAGGFGIEFGAGDADEQELTGIVRWHIDGKTDFIRSVEMISSQNIGLFGGSFDPIHHGHLILAREAMEKLGLERVVFIPANISPHKLDRPPVSAAVRCEMLEAAIEDEAGFFCDRCEAERPGPSFAVDTVRLMASRFPGARLFYFIGEDNVAGLETWREIDVLRRMVSFVVLTRGGFSNEGGFPVISRNVDISSTDIRNRIAHGLSVRYLLPDATCKIIQQYRLYRNEH